MKQVKKGSDRMKNPGLKSLIMVGLAMSLKGCMPTAVVGGATALGTAATEERGLGGVLTDTEIKTRLNFIYSSRDPDLFADVDIVVRQGRVLLTGTVETLQKQINAVRYAWEIKGVKEVIDELRVGKGSDLGDAAKDAWMTAQVKTRLLFDGDVSSVNYNIQTVNGVVYLMGVAQNQKELNHVVNIVRHVDGVKKVINYVKIKDIPLHFKEDGSFESPLESSAYSHPTGVSQPVAYQPAVPAQQPQSAARPQQAADLNHPNQSSAFD